MAKIDKKKPTHKANANSKSAKPAPKMATKPTVINKGPKKKLDLKKKDFKPAGKFDKTQKNTGKGQKDNKPKAFASNGHSNSKKFDGKKPAPTPNGFKVAKKEVRIEQSSKQEYLKKKELKKKEHENSQLLRKQQTGKAEAPVAKGKAPTVAADATKTKKADAKAGTAAGRKSKKPKDENELDDVFIDDSGSNEIEEYEDELKAVEELDNETDDDLLLEAETKDKKYEDIELTDAEGNKLCRSRDCDQIAVVDGYCRYHYLLFWKNIQVRKKILQDGKLERYIEELTSRYPDKFLEMIRRDLRSQKDFMAAIQELEIDESNLDGDFEEDTQSFIDEVRGVNEGSSIEEEFE